MAQPEHIFNAAVLAAVVTACVGAIVTPVITAIIGGRSMRHEAQIKIATDAHLRLLERQINDVGELRQRIRTVLADLHRLGNEAYFNGATEETIRLVRGCREAVRATTTVGTYVPPGLLEGAEQIIRRLEDLIDDVAVWSRHEQPEMRRGPCATTSDCMRGLAEQSRQLFGTWQRDLLAGHDEVLGIACRPGRVVR